MSVVVHPSKGLDNPSPLGYLLAMTGYATHFSRRVTPQTEQALPNQVENSAGGFTFQLDDWGRLSRFLILGSESNTYYSTARKFTRENVWCIDTCLTSDPGRTIETILEVSESGRAPKNDPAVFALAMAASHTDPAARAGALLVLPRVCRTGTHLFQFAESVSAMRGWGRGLRRAVGNWYLNMPAEKLAYQVTKYRRRGGWSHRDLLRLSHPKMESPGHELLAKWVTEGYPVEGMASGMFDVVDGFMAAQEADGPNRVAALIQEYGLTHEMVPTQALAHPEVWEALLEKMPMGALVRNLGRMTANGTLKPMSSTMRSVVSRLRNQSMLHKARIHPLSLLTAQVTYAQGHGLKGKLKWSPVPQITDALNDAFYASFKNITPTNKRTLMALDVSGSMDWGTIAGSPLTPRVASAAMAMVTAQVEKNYGFMAFSHSAVSINLSAGARLDQVVKALSRLPFGGTDCALPMLTALENKLDVDTFVVYTDNETWAGKIHPHQALEQYRQKTGINAKLIVVGMTATDLTIANPNDAGMLDVVGFDSAAPQVMADFSRE